MSHIRGRAKAAAIVLGAATGLVALTGTAAAAPAAPAPGTNLIRNGDFAKPGPAKHEGATPTDWKLVDLGVETDPYDAAIGVYNKKGEYPPPKGNPNSKDIADEVFYEAGSATGIEGIAGEQTSAQFGSITQANNPQVSFSNVEKDAPEASVANWAGSGLQIDFTHAKKSYTLVYFNQWTAYESTFSSSPTNSATTKYVLGPTLTALKWNTWAARSLNSDIDAKFGFKTYKVNDVLFIDWEDTTDSGKPYPNMDGYIADVAIDQGPAA
jgi:hypothetical protein